MIENLVIGLPHDRPGGLVLTLVYFAGSAAAALGAGFLYAGLCLAFPRASLLLQAATALVRGIPLLLLVFLLAQLTPLPLDLAGFAALAAYSFVHVGEILRSFVGAYPRSLHEQARVLGLGAGREWLQIRVPRTLAYALDALATHWISLLKDTGALVVLSIGELTTVAKALSESTANYGRWQEILVAAAALYLATTLAVIAALRLARRIPAVAALAA